jgi:low temperature requirement protein LtrA
MVRQYTTERETPVDLSFFNSHRHSIKTDAGEIAYVDIGEGPAALGFVAIACLWWVYFDGGVEDRFSERTGAAELYTRVHIALLLALTAVGAGVQLLIEPTAGRDASTAGAWAFDGGTSVYLLCLTINQRLTATGLSTRVRIARLACTALLLACATQVTHTSPLVVAAVTAACLTVLVIYEIDEAHRLAHQRGARAVQM